eukprot:5401131-Prymnesium_polylepis.1
MDGRGTRSGTGSVGCGASCEACPCVASHNGCVPSSSARCARCGSSSGCSSRGAGSSVSEAMLGPAGCLRTPDCHLMVLIAIRELIRAAIVDIEALALLGKVSRRKRTLGDSGGERFSMVASWAALPIGEPLTVEEGAVDEVVVDVLLHNVQ